MMDIKTLFFYESTLDTLQLKKDKGIDYVLSSKLNLINLMQYIMLPYIV